MPKLGYSISGLDPDKTAKASGREVRVSPKAAREVCNLIRGMRLGEAKELLQEVAERKRAVPFKRYRKEVPHRRGLEKWYAGRYPVKATKEILRILESAEANAENKELDVERLRIIHIAAQRAGKIKKYIPRAFGRATPDFEQLCHIEVVVGEK